MGSTYLNVSNHHIVDDFAGSGVNVKRTLKPLPNRPAVCNDDFGL